MPLGGGEAPDAALLPARSGGPTPKDHGRGPLLGTRRRLRAEGACARGVHVTPRAAAPTEPHAWVHGLARSEAGLLLLSRDSLEVRTAALHRTIHLMQTRPEPPFQTALFVRRNKRAPLIFFPPTSGTTFGEQACEPTPQHGAASHTQQPVTLPPSPLRGGPGPVAGVREASQRHGPRRELGGKVKTQVARAASPCCKVTALF